MASHLLFFRLPKGRVWHVACSGAQVALCGQSIPTRGERQPKRPPFGARPCPDCNAVANEAVVAVGAAIIAAKPVARPIAVSRDILLDAGPTMESLLADPVGQVLRP